MLLVISVFVFLQATAEIARLRLSNWAESIGPGVGLGHWTAQQQPHDPWRNPPRQPKPSPWGPAWRAPPPGGSLWEQPRPTRPVLPRGVRVVQLRTPWGTLIRYEVEPRA